jgi:hypothetical protein
MPQRRRPDYQSKCYKMRLIPLLLDQRQVQHPHSLQKYLDLP